MTTATQPKTPARPKIHFLGYQSSEAVKKGPSQVPIEEQSGVYMDRYALETFSKDTLGRDIFSVEGRIREWEETEELYHRHKDAPLPVDTSVTRLPEFGIHLFAGDMGEGKTLMAAHVARQYRRRGWNVFSTAGFLFGQRLRLIEAYAFPDHVTPGSLIFVDEVHTLIDRYSANSIRSRTFGQASTAMRKEKVTCIGASAHTVMVGWEFKGVAETVVTPRRWYPPGPRVAPPFCYLTCAKLYPFPYRRKDPLLMEAGLIRGSETKIAWWNPDPIELIGAARLIDSFESVKIGENFGVDAAAMRKEREQTADSRPMPQGNDRPDLFLVIKAVWDQDYINKRQERVRFSTIRDIIKQAGMNVSGVDIRSTLEIAGCPVTGETVRVDDLAMLFGYMYAQEAEEG